MRLIDADKLVEILENWNKFIRELINDSDTDDDRRWRGLIRADANSALLEFIKSDRLNTLEIPMGDTYRGKHEVKR